ncbi:ATP-binding protein [Anaerocolumna sp.]|uniref:ATP-binding protein n=1 Tax=Anaerocolumna sp. TaxID=2041569 RepID=UPI0028A5CC5E|nr:4Fe-4S binding protein [Anaerocolumna sp.]
MIRKIITIDEEKCNGCGLCVSACHEGAIGLVDGKATLLRDDYCDGLGNCLPVCPVNAISFEEREALEYNEEEVLRNMAMNKSVSTSPVFHGCPGSQANIINHSQKQNKEKSEDIKYEAPASMLNQWPVQIKLVPVNAPYFDNANLLIAADCTAFAYGDFHNSFMKNKITLIGCPKLDDIDYSEKLTEILKYNNIKNITVVRMTVPCCGGIVNAVTAALKNSGKMIPWQVVTISPDGVIIE